MVYKINCDSCYVGQTSRNLMGIIASHKSDCKLKLNACVLYEH